MESSINMNYPDLREDHKISISENRIAKAGTWSK
jgi:hypothetical protein